MPAISFIVNVDIEDDVPDDLELTEDLSKALLQDKAERKIKENLRPGMHYKIVDISPTFEPEPKFSHGEVSTIVFGDVSDISHYGV